MAQQPPPSRTKILSDGGLTAIAVSSVFSFISSIAVALRFYVRRVKKVGVLVEDWLILAALVGPSGCARAQSRLGIGTDLSLDSSMELRSRRLPT